MRGSGGKAPPKATAGSCIKVFLFFTLEKKRLMSINLVYVHDHSLTVKPTLKGRLKVQCRSEA